MSQTMSAERRGQRDPDHTRTGPGTPAGRYLRSFWQPVYHSTDLAPGSAVPLRIMGESFTLYRGEGGTTFLVDPYCPHRGTQLSSGWVEGDALRCFYHGWKFAGDGRCIEQPAEDSAFCHKVALRAYPSREYLGFVFAYLGEGAPPDFPTYPEFEHFDGLVEIDSYSRDCNYYQNIENSLDMCHVAFVHRDNQAAFRTIGHGKRLQAEESDWGVRYIFTREDGQRRIQQFGMPNIFYMTALPTDPQIGWQESLFWWVPIDDDCHMQFSLHRVPATGEAAQRIYERRQKRRSEIDIPHQEVCMDVLEGRIKLTDVDTARVDLVRLQDDIAQIGQGRIADREAERLGRSDVGLIAIRKLWQRDVEAMLAGRPIKQWRRNATIVPRAWGLAGQAPRIGADSVALGSQADIVDVRPYEEVVDVRPYAEIDIQLRALQARSVR